CDFTYDSGRGDDCLAKYVEAAKGVALDCPPGAHGTPTPGGTYVPEHLEDSSSPGGESHGQGHL
ncbi:hypothetical protein ABZ302_23250, partial [Streptomyces sp. NPDC006237]|uniref:hypothetical protein n=1 Tax=Streptomyces sp. NPDC006237 TaxID=3154474 RepID=UPI0033A7FADB